MRPVGGVSWAKWGMVNIPKYRPVDKDTATPVTKRRGHGQGKQSRRGSGALRPGTGARPVRGVPPRCDPVVLYGTGTPEKGGGGGEGPRLHLPTAGAAGRGFPAPVRGSRRRCGAPGTPQAQRCTTGGKQQNRSPQRGLPRAGGPHTGQRHRRNPPSTNRARSPPSHSRCPRLCTGHGGSARLGFPPRAAAAAAPRPPPSRCRWGSRSPRSHPPPTPPLPPL